MLEITSIQNPVMLEAPMVQTAAQQGSGTVRGLVLLILILVIAAWLAYGLSLSRRVPTKRTTKCQL